LINIIINEIFEAPDIDPAVLEKTAVKVLEHEKKGEEVDISIALEDNAHLQELNLQFLGIDAPTDVFQPMKRIRTQVIYTLEISSSPYRLP